MILGDNSNLVFLLFATTKTDDWNLVLTEQQRKKEEEMPPPPTCTQMPRERTIFTDRSRTRYQVSVPYLYRYRVEGPSTKYRYDLQMMKTTRSCDVSMTSGGRKHLYFKCRLRVPHEFVSTLNVKRVPHRFYSPVLRNVRFLSYRMLDLVYHCRTTKTRHDRHFSRGTEANNKFKKKKRLPFPLQVASLAKDRSYIPNNKP